MLKKLKENSGPAGDQQSWQRRVAEFVKNRDDETLNNRRKRLRDKSSVEPVRVATMQWMLDINHSMQWLGSSLSDFFISEEQIKQSEQPPTLVISTDQEGTQLAATNFLKWHLNACIEHTYDPQHRRSNDTTLALGQAGVLKQACHAVGLYNLQYGPWQKGGFHEQVVDAATEMKEGMSPNDDLLKLFFDDILLDLGESLENNNEARRLQYLQELPNSPIVKSKGPKASMSRFNSLQHSQDHIDKHWSSFALILTVICLTQKFVDFADELWAPAGAVAAILKEQPPVSAATAKKEAKEALNNMRSKTRNTLHLYCKWMNDPVNKNLARMLFYLQKPESDDSGQMLASMRSAAACREHFKKWSQWSFLEIAQQQIAVLSNLTLLSRMGFEMSRSERTKSELTEEKLQCEDALARKCWLVLCKLLKFRLGSMTWHTWSLPGICAGLLFYEDTAKQQETRSLLRTIDQVVLACEERGSLAAKELLQGQGCNSPLMRWLRHRFREEAPDFSTTPACVGRCIYEIFGGLLNTKLVEDLNKLQREHECRDTNRQEVSPSLSWRAGTQHNLLGTYDRQELKVSCLTNMPRDYESDAFYNRNIVKNETAEHKKLQHDLKKVTGPATWYICTPESQQQTFANLALLTEIGDEYHKVETAWHASLLPEHQVVTKSSQASTSAAKYYFVVRSYRNAALAWEMSCVNRKKPKEKEFTFKKVRKLEWLFLFNKDDYLVHRLTAHSPSRVWMLNEKQTGAGCSLSSSMEPKTLEQHHTKHGFSGIPEDVLKKMCNEWEVGVATVPKGVSEQQALQTALTLHHDPATTAEEVLAKVFDNSGALEGECSDEILEEVQQIMEDSVIQQDRDKILSILKKSDQAKQNRQKSVESLTAYFEETVKVLPPAKAAERKKSLTKKPTKKEAAPVPKDKKAEASSSQKKTQDRSMDPPCEPGSSYDNRHYQKLNEDIDEYLRKGKPENMHILTDPKNGRWRLTWKSAEATEQRSVSWTNVGAKLAGEEVLKQGWDWSRTYLGQDMPPEAKRWLEMIRNHS